MTIAIDDVITPPQKQEILVGDEDDAGQDREAVRAWPAVTDGERREELIEVWTEATNKVAKAMNANFPKRNPVFMMVNSGARGNMMQVRQIAGMRGLVANPKGEIIPRPIKANFREGLSVLEYFISTHGARKGLADTALRTADSGLPDPSSGGRLPGRDHPRGGLRHRAGHRAADRVEERGRLAGPGRRTPRPRCAPARWPPTSATRTGKVVAAGGADLGDVAIDELVAAGIGDGQGPLRPDL